MQYLTKPLRAAVIALAIGAAAVDCDAAQAETVVRVAMTAGDIPDWTGQPDQGAEGYRFVGYQLYDALINWDLSRSDREATLRPGLATKWYADPNDRTRWVFELRQGVKYHDGCPWNADSALWNLKRLTDEKAPGFSLPHFARIRSRTSNIARVEKVDDNTIAIYTKTVESLFPWNMTSPLMISPCAMEKAGNDPKAYGAKPVGTGPYKFASVVPHERLELVKNADYWDKDRIPKHDRLVLLPMPEASTRTAAILSGQVDFVEAPSPDTIPTLKKAGMNIVTLSYPHNWDYTLNFQRGPFKDLRVRQAANYAINRDEIVDLLAGTAIAGYGIFTPDQKWFGHPIKYGYDPKKAAALLKEAGCLPCNIKVAISTSGSGQMQPLPMNELVKAQLEAVGFKVELVVMDWNAMVDLNLKGWQKDPSLDAVNISLFTSDPANGLIKTIATTYRAPQGWNWGWYQNAEVDKISDAVNQTFDEDEQTKLIQKMHEIVVGDAVRVFIAHDLNPRALSPRLKGFVQAQSWFQDLTPIVVTDGKK